MTTDSPDYISLSASLCFALYHTSASSCSGKQLVQVRSLLYRCIYRCS